MADTLTYSQSDIASIQEVAKLLSMTDPAVNPANYVNGNIDEAFTKAYTDNLQRLQNFAGGAPQDGFETLIPKLDAKITQMQSALQTYGTIPGRTNPITQYQTGIPAQQQAAIATITPLLERANPDLAPYSNGALQFMAYYEGYKPHLSHVEQLLARQTGQDLSAESDASAAAQDSAPEQASAPPPDMEEAQASIILESFLIQTGPKLSTAIKENFGVDVAISTPADNAADGIFDEGSQRGLQQVLGALVQPEFLNLSRFQERFQEQGNIAVAYSPDLGRAIVSALENPKTPGAQKIKEQLIEAANTPPLDERFKNESDKGVAIARYLTAQMDILRKKKKIGDVVLAEMAQFGSGSLGPVEKVALNFIIGWIAKIWPQALPMLDGFVRQLNGGLGLDSLIPGFTELPAIKNNPELSQLLGDMDTMTPDEQLVASFKYSFRHTNTQEEREKMVKDLVSATNKMSFLDQRGDAASSEAVENALTEAMKLMEGLKPGDPGFEAALTEAAHSYADTLLDDLYTVTQENGLSALQDTSHKRVALDPANADRMLAAGLDLGERPIGAASGNDIDRIYAVYVQSYNPDQKPGFGEPMIFQDQNGKTFIATIDKDSKLFSVHSFDIDAIRQRYNDLIEAGTAPGDAINSLRTYSAISPDQPADNGFALAYDNHYDDFLGYGIGLSGTFLTGTWTPDITIDFANYEKSYTSLTNDFLSSQQHTLWANQLRKHLQNDYNAHSPDDRLATQLNPYTRDMTYGQNRREYSELLSGVLNDYKTTKDFAPARKMVAENYQSFIDPNSGDVVAFFKTENGGIVHRTITDEIAVYLNASETTKTMLRNNPAEAQRVFPKLFEIANRYDRFKNLDGSPVNPMVLANEITRYYNPLRGITSAQMDVANNSTHENGNNNKNETARVDEKTAPQSPQDAFFEQELEKGRVVVSTPSLNVHYWRNGQDDNANIRTDLSRLLAANDPQNIDLSNYPDLLRLTQAYGLNGTQATAFIQGQFLDNPAILEALRQDPSSCTPAPGMAV